MGVYFILWIICAFISTCYTLTWDIKMDWGLLERDLKENTLLREEVVYPSKVISKSKQKNVGACTADILLFNYKLNLLFMDVVST